mmetsp:Transcript_9028/g.15423  ORF Transcript_9028/g.15423 Transcript_9028/m.15423 type:complete len:177 (-) Transcript_9028:39-569(-)
MKYLICYDDSKYAQKAIDFIISAASKKRDDIVLFGATEISSKSQQTLESPRDKHDEEALPPEWKQTHARLVKAKKKLVEAGFEKIAVETCVTEDIRVAVDEVCDSDGIDTIVVGCRGYQAPAKMYNGSLASYLTRHATRPVIVIRGKVVDDDPNAPVIPRTKRVSGDHHESKKSKK